jgi:hypothetical protein
MTPDPVKFSIEIHAPLEEKEKRAFEDSLYRFLAEQNISGLIRVRDGTGIVILRCPMDGYTDEEKEEAYDAETKHQGELMDWMAELPKEEGRCLR